MILEFNFVKSIWDKYMKGLSLRQCAPLMGFKCYRAVKRQFSHYNLPLSNNKHFRRKYTNDNYFKSLDSEFKAYIYGYIVADGGIRNNTLKLKLHKKDKSVLEELSQQICKYIYLYKEGHNYIFQISSKQIFTDLKALGLKENKTYTGISIPQIDKKLLRHFVRGFLDGDGHAGIYFYDKAIQRIIQFTSTDRAFLESLSKLIEENCGARRTDLKIKCETKTAITYDLIYRSQPSITKIFYWLYSDHEFSLARKYNQMYLCTLTSREREVIKDLLPCRD